MTMEFTCGLLPWNGRAREELADCKEELYFAERESENFKDCPKVGSLKGKERLAGVLQDIQVRPRSGVHLDPGLRLHLQEAS